MLLREDQAEGLEDAVDRPAGPRGQEPLDLFMSLNCKSNQQTFRW